LPDFFFVLFICAIYIPIVIQGFRLLIIW
jgi:hypothetical protein